MTQIEQLNEEFWNEVAPEVAKYICDGKYSDARAVCCDYFLRLISLYNPEKHDENAVYFIFYYTEFPLRYMDTLYPDYFHREAITKEKFIYITHEMKGTWKYKFYTWIKNNYQKLPLLFKNYIFKNKDSFNMHFINPLNFLFDNNAALSVELESYFNPTDKGLSKETLIKIIEEYNTQGTSPTLIKNSDSFDN